MSVRADVVDTGHKKRRAGKIIIHPPIQKIFDILADPYRHREFDGSGTVTACTFGPQRLEQGAQFGMDVRIAVPYQIKNTVMDFDEPSRIAWRHLGHHRWRYELRSIDPTTTEVTETLDGSTARFPPALALMNAYDNNQKAIVKTLVRSKEIAESHG